MIYQQMSIFDDIIPSYKNKNPIRLIEFFGGIGAQAKALEILGVPFEHHRLVEWAYNSYCSYNAIHQKNFQDFTENLTKEQMLARIRGTSMNYNDPLSNEQLAKKPIEWIRNAYNNCVATNNLINIMDVHAADLGIVDKDKFTYIVSYSFPCQDLSLAGKRAGMSVSQADGGTRSGLLWEVERILGECKELGCLPQILVMENVPQVIETKNVNDWRKWVARLGELGYSNFCDVLNAKDYGLPQNRKRCFMISILGEWNYTFPLKMHLDHSLKDMLEPIVDEKYFLSQKFINYVTHNSSDKYNRAERFEQSLNTTNNKGIAVALTTRQGRGPLDNYISIKNNNSKGFEDAMDGDGIDISTRMHHHRGTVQHGSCQTLTTMGGENVGVVVPDLKHQLCNKLVEEGKVVEGDIVKHSFTNQILSGKKKAVEKQDEMITLTTRGDTFGVAVKDYENYVTWRNNQGEFNTQCNRACKEDKVSLTVPTSNTPNVAITERERERESNLRIRKLTPLECFKLMGFDQNDYAAVRGIGMSDAMIYHMAGDSICTTVLVALFSQLFNDNEDDRHVDIIKNYVNSLTNRKEETV